MRLLGFPTSAGATFIAAFALAFIVPGAAIAMDPLPEPSGSAAATSGSLPLIGRVRATTPFCRLIVNDAASLADNQLADIRTTTEAMRILAYAPLDRDRITERRAVRALETLVTRLMTSRRGDAASHVAGLRAAALGTEGQAPRPALARFAGALDGAHSESSRVAHEISRALSVLEDVGNFTGGMYLADDLLANDPRFAPARTPVPFPVDAELERFPADLRVENGPLHVYARNAALSLSDSLARMLGSIEEARRLFPTAFADCSDVDVSPSPAADGGQ